jgi:cytoskeletal protein CcmA (bactofilin family)
MFKTKSKNQMAKQSDMNSGDRVNRIVEGTKIEGTLRSDANIRIEGTFTGTVDTKGKLVIGPNGIIDGEVTCSNAEVEGKIIGKITVEDLLSLKSSARIEGDIFTSKLSIDPGAMFSGSCNMGNKVKQMNHEHGEKIQEKTA